MKNSRVNVLKTVCQDLRSSIEASDAVSMIVPDTRMEESMLVGSPDSLLRLALSLIELVVADAAHDSDNQKAEEDEVFGIKVATSDRVKDVFDEFSPVWPVCAYMARSDADARRLGAELAAQWKESQ